ncbi:acyl-CoA dehydrogenase family protein [Actinomadura livida]|uniref:Acyl-CoA dehydrogenase family protein n=1 Tax=Actinomadura livida TaxID=79909 RepID=A0A7W7MY93_9ACTN|nr:MULTISPECIES: acyl-CoA dehydrogenase family protein [Actinomadura]MBB4774724.1 alkylation response protein AidB-like acyl-CoA dehydrogenase [Actinomadura catellatispora]GGU06408.1 acyl-CoA dehydrogenase [Actinomadura livida]
MIDEPGLDDFRAGLRSWIEREVPADWRDRLRGDLRELYVWWASALRDAGYGPPHWAREHGGPGLSLARQLVVYEEVALGDCPDYPGLFSCAYNHVYSTLTAHGTPDQAAAHLPPILAHDRVWAQAFSEPEAGSDLASLRTTATRDGDRYIVNGQKIWSTRAPHADWAILLARTDPDAPKRRGLSYFLVDLSSPGIEVRPIKQITGVDDDFAEIFFTGVSVPAANLVGRENDGWRVAQTTLASERGPLAVPTALRLRRMLDAALPLAIGRAEDEGADFATSSVGRRYADLHADVEILAELIYGTLARFIEAGTPGVEASLIKLFLSGLMQRTSEFGLDMAGAAGHYEQPGKVVRGLDTHDWLVEHLESWVWTIAGGTDQIQRNIIGERVLGLPRDPLVS